MLEKKLFHAKSKVSTYTLTVFLGYGYEKLVTAAFGSSEPLCLLRLMGMMLMDMSVPSLYHFNTCSHFIYFSGSIMGLTTSRRMYQQSPRSQAEDIKVA